MVEAILSLSHIHQAFPRANGEPITIIEDVSLALRPGEIVGVLGRSGCGKSTLLRIASGLLRPTSGTVTYRGHPLQGPAEGIAMVFQTFALFPWLTVLDNVTAGLDAIGVKPEAARRRAQAAIELIGLDGFEAAYPRELSGGMRQRVGFARALVVEPAVLLMDEAFSALDVLTAETLRSDFIDLWTAKKVALQSVMLVTHNIEEAVFLCDRIIVLTTHPGRIALELAVALPQPRNRLSPAFREIVDDIYERMTAGRAPVAQPQKAGLEGLGLALPHVTSLRITAFLTLLAEPPLGGKAELRALAGRLHCEVDAILSIADAAQILGFAAMQDGLIHLTAAGRLFADAAAEGRKRIFSEHLLRSVPLAAHIHRILHERSPHAAPRARFLPELQDHLSHHQAEQTLTAVIDWGRYAGIFSYDQRHHRFSLSEDAGAQAVE